MVFIRATIRSSRQAGSGAAKHNDRQFNLDKAKHIDQERLDKNIYWHVYKKKHPEMTFSEAQLEFYQRKFGKHLEFQNEKNIKARHKERVMDMQTYLEKHPPEEVILQIGALGDDIPAQKLVECVNDYVKRYQEHFGSNSNIISIAIHRDESSVHAHVLRAFYSIDVKSMECAYNEGKAMLELGFRPPNEDEPIGRFNSPKMSFSKEERNLWLDIIEEHGLTVEREPLEGRQHIDIASYKAQKDLERAEAELEEVKSELSRLRDLQRRLEEIIEALRNGMLELARSVLKEHQIKRDMERSR